jgi:hypothetical protein
MRLILLGIFCWPLALLVLSVILLIWGVRVTLVLSGMIAVVAIGATVGLVHAVRGPAHV